MTAADDTPQWQAQQTNPLAIASMVCGMTVLQTAREIVPALHWRLAAWWVEGLMNYFQVVAVEVADVGRVVAGPEIGPRFRLAFARSARFDGGSIDGVDLGVVIGDNPEIKAGLARLPLA